MRFILWLSHPASSHGIVWVGAAVSPVVAGDSVVYHFHSVAKIMIRVKGRDVTIRLPFLRCKQKVFDVRCVFECGFDMMERLLV